MTAVNPNDADLIELCRQALALDDEARGIAVRFNEMYPCEPEYRALSEADQQNAERWIRFRELIARTPAHTLGGVKAKAQVAIRDLADEFGAGQKPLDEDYALVWSICRELVGADVHQDD